jgi:uncharacterized protein YllA (UPF0747 family)
VALAHANERWGNPVQEQLQAWLAGAKVVVTGQQPGLLGGPLLSLVKACAVAAEVGALQAGGTPAVGFFWLETRDDDLPEMGWARLFCAGELREARENWQRRQAMASAASLSQATWELLDWAAAGQLPAPALSLLEQARTAFAPGALLGEACAGFLAGLLRHLGLVVVDASLPEVARAAAQAASTLAGCVPDLFRSLQAKAQQLREAGLPAPLRVSAEKLPFFRRQGAQRLALSTAAAAEVAKDLALNPEAYTPNVWLRPLLQDAALATDVAILGSSELAYHWQGQELWPLVGLKRPQWRLRPHVTLLGATERRLLRKLGLSPEELLKNKLPARLLPQQQLASRLARLAEQTLRQLDQLGQQARQELPALAADWQATEKRLEATFAWLSQRLALRREEQAGLQKQRFTRLLAALRPQGKAQERALSLLSPLLALGPSLPAQLTKALEALAPFPESMALLFWEEGGLW